MTQTNHTQQTGDGTNDSAAVSSVRRSRRRRQAASQLNSAVTTDEIAASYSRYSSDQQREEGILDQQRACRTSAEANGHKLLVEYEYADEAISGTKLRRTGLDQLLRDAESGEFRVLYFYSLSRLARESVITMPMLKQLVHNFGVRVISVTEGIDSDRDGWEVIASIMSLLHERYIKELSANVFRGQEGAVLAGFAVGDHCFGYTTVPVEGTEATRHGKNAKPRMRYVIDPVTSAWVLRIFFWFVREGRSIRWITRELNRRSAPKDHRATTPKWHHQQVAGVLGRVKYVGSWPWGERKNARDPLTGQVRQEDRPEDACEKWIRDLPYLRIIDDETFDAAQRMLDANIERHVATRRPNGTLAGSQRGSTTPRHLLSGLIQCGECGATFHVGGTHGRYLFCPNYSKGNCSCKTQLRRDRAESMILERIGTGILDDDNWFAAIFESLQCSWREGMRRRPAELAAAENCLADIDRKIERLIDRVENGYEDSGLKERLSQRRSERREQLKTIDRLKKTREQGSHEPTEEWLRSELKQLGRELRTDIPAAAIALRNLVGGKIVVTEVSNDGRKRHDLQGRFTIKVDSVAAAVAGFSLAPETIQDSSTSNLSEPIVIDFVDPSPLEGPSEEAKRFYDMKLMNSEIAKRMCISKSQVTKLLKYWFESRALTMPDGRSRRSTLKRKHSEPPLYQRISDQVKQLCDDGLLLGVIAKRLKCDRNTITKAITYWYESRELEAPDGRTRRKTLDRKREKRRGDEDRDSKNDAAA
ncbi:MAG: recombinase family protein [Planctomycetaceae bacterium]|nr:recombinase family protein [Planctomycetaceae bacterium]MCB9923082.1 recombinase family protein [Planctomycetaceae bacterium]